MILLPTYSSQPATVPMDDKEILKKKLAQLKNEHRQLDEEITRMSAEVPFDQLQIQRLKKRKLALKDQIARLDNQLMPDIIA